MQDTMLDKPPSRPKGGLLRRVFAPRRVLVNTAMVVYCVVLLLIFDFVWSSFTQGQEKARAVRIYDPVYDHGFAANFSGFDVWGEVRYPLITNSLGFKDASTREVPLKSTSRRILLIGDSFTEGIGLPFENTFAGLLAEEGAKRPGKVEFLNAGVASYSPSIYYAKVKYLLEKGLTFDEVVLFSDSSDVEDEASSYFCIDEDPKYRKFCNTPAGSVPQPAIKRDYFIEHFAVTNRVRVTFKRWIRSRLGNKRHMINDDHDRTGWTTATPNLWKYEPLGVDGGIARSVANMTKLSDLLASRNIPLTIVVYPWAQQIAQNDRDSKQVRLWRDFCPGRCKAFIDLFPPIFAASDADPDWYAHLYIVGDDHFSAQGNRVMFEELKKRLF